MIDANLLLGTRHDPPGWAAIRDRGMEAYAYHRLDPYPFFHFKDWRTEARGPLPKCLPLCRDVVRKGARWLFGKPVPIDAQDAEAAQERLREIWTANQMAARLVRMAESAAVWGGAVLFFAFDEEREEPVTLRVFNPSTEARCYFDPDDRTRLLMLRLQYPYQDSRDGAKYWYREDWTDDRRVVYEPEKVDALTVVRPFDLPGAPGTDLRVRSREENPFGIVPAWLVRNAETEGPTGEGDLWDLFRIVDRVNLTYHLMDKSNQLDSEPNKVYIDAKFDGDDGDKPLAPGQSEAINSSEESKQAKVELLEPRGSLRPHMMEYAQEVARQIRSACGSVDLDAAAITNKGNLTRQVMSLMFAPLIEITDEKRKLYGEDGIAKFLERLCVGLANVGHASFTGDEDVTLRWPDYFPLSDEEKTTRVALLQIEETAGYMSHERAVDRVAQMEGVEDVKALEAELLSESKAKADVETAAEPQDEDAVARKNTDSLKQYAVKSARA